MSNLKESSPTTPKIDLSYLDTAAQQLSETGVYTGELQAQDMQVIVTQVTSQLLGNFGDKVTIDGSPTYEVIIAPSAKDGRNTLTADVKADVTKPLKSSLHLRINFKNKSEGTLENTGLTIESSNQALQLILSATKETKIRPVLADSDSLFLKALNQQMESRGIGLTGGRFTINPDSITIGLTGKPIVSS